MVSEVLFGKNVGVLFYNPPTRATKLRFRPLFLVIQECRRVALQPADPRDEASLPSVDSDLKNNPPDCGGLFSFSAVGVCTVGVLIVAPAEQQ